MNIIKRIFFLFISLFPMYSFADDFCEKVSTNIVPFEYFLNSSPNPIRNVHTEGLMPQNISPHIVNSMKDMTIIGRLTKSWLVSKKPETLNKIILYLVSWLKTYKPNFNPIDETKFDTLFFSYYMTREAIPKSERELIDLKVKYWAEGYLKEMKNPGLRNSNNNWQSHRIKLITIMALSINDDFILSEAKRFFLKQISDNIDGNFVTIDYKQHNAIRYVIYDLLPLVQSATYAKLAGYSWGNIKIDDKTKLVGAIKWVMPYATGIKKHEEFKGAIGLLDIKRRLLNLNGYSGEYSPEYSDIIFWYLSYLLPPIVEQYNINLNPYKEPVVMSFYCNQSN